MSSSVSPHFIRRTKSVVMSLQTIKEGTLYKRGKINPEWRQRLFVLNGKQLAYFKGRKHTPSGIIELKDIRNVIDIIETEGIFQLETPNRTYDIRGESAQQTKEWIDAVKDARNSLAT